MTDQWFIKRFQDPEGEFEENLFDVEVIDAVNRFGRKATAYIDDSGGQRRQKYRRGTGVEFFVSSGDDPSTQNIRSIDTLTVNSGETISGATWYNEGEVLNAGTVQSTTEKIERRFAGMVVEPREVERNGADVVEVEVYSFDYFLRQNTIERDFSGELFSTALQEIIEDFTPVKWVADNVDVVNDDELTRSYQGEKVDTFLNEISSKSANEEYGVNNDVEFFFRPREFGTVPRGVDNTQWFDYDFPEEGKQTVNELQLFYGSGDNTGSVIVDDGADKQELQANLGLSGAGTLRKEVTYEDITTESDARDKAEEILNQKSSIERGEVSTYGLYGAEPGDVISIDIQPVGIDQDFRIAEIEYRWAEDETVLQLVEKSDKDDERLVEITDTLGRVERRNADRDAIATRFIDTEIGGNFSVELQFSTRLLGNERFNPGFGRDAMGFGREDVGVHVSAVIDRSEQDSRATNQLRNAVRDGWRGNGNPSTGTVAIGTDSTELSRQNTTLGNEVESTSADATPSGEKVIRWDAAISPNGAVELSEAGILEGDTLHARAVTSSFEVPANTPVDVAFSIRVSNNEGESGVQTNDGQETIRDIIADNSPDLPAEVAFGSDNTQADESDTSLYNELIRIAIDRFRNRGVGQVETFARLDETQAEGEVIGETGTISSSGKLLTRSTFAEFTKEATESDGSGGQAVENKERFELSNK